MLTTESAVQKLKQMNGDKLDRPIQSNQSYSLITTGLTLHLHLYHNLWQLFFLLFDNKRNSPCWDRNTLHSTEGVVECSSEWFEMLIVALHRLHDIQFVFSFVYLLTSEMNISWIDILLSCRSQKCIVLTVYFILYLQTSEMSDIYTVYTRMPFSLPFVDVVGTKPGQDGVEIQLGEVCFAWATGTTGSRTINL